MSTPRDALHLMVLADSAEEADTIAYELGRYCKPHDLIQYAVNNSRMRMQGEYGFFSSTYGIYAFTHILLYIRNTKEDYAAAIAMIAAIQRNRATYHSQSLVVLVSEEPLKEGQRHGMQKDDGKADLELSGKLTPANIMRTIRQHAQEYVAVPQNTSFRP